MRFMEAHNGLSALIANQTSIEDSGRQFDGIWVSSLTCTAVNALPDLEMTVVDNRLQIIRQIAEVSAIPVIVDGDTGGSVPMFRYFCRALAMVGVAGVIVEEKESPKRNSLDEADQQLADPYAFGMKMAAGRDAVDDDEFMIIARLESLMNGLGLEDALRRACHYAEVGIDGVMIHSKASDAGEVLEFCKRFRELGHKEPIFCVPTTYHRTRAEQLLSGGVQGVIYANHQLRAAHTDMHEVCRSILANDRSTESEPDISPIRQLLDEIGHTDEVLFLAEMEKAAARRVGERSPKSSLRQSGEPE